MRVKINLRTANELHGRLRWEFEINIVDVFPMNYQLRIKMALGPKIVTAFENKDVASRLEFRTRLDLVDAETLPIKSVKSHLWDSSKLWELTARGVVVNKCNEDIVAKVITGNKNYIEYTSLQFLAEHALDIPASRPHGLIAFGPFRVIFMIYIPNMTLTEAWPSMSHKNKLSIKYQLDDIFR